MEFLVFLVLAAVAFAVWRYLKHAYLGMRMRQLTRRGDPALMYLHEHLLSRDWYSLDPAMRAAMALDFQRDPNRAYAVFASGGSDLQPADFQRIMRQIIAGDPACAHVRGDAG